MGTHSYIIDLNSNTFTDLGTLGGSFGYAAAINDAGQVTGWLAATADLPHAFITGPNGVGITDLGTVGGQNYSQATGVNATGQVTGTHNPAGAEYNSHAFITGPNGVGATDLGKLAGAQGFTPKLYQF